MKIGGSIARNIGFEVANFQVLLEIPGKTLIFNLQVSKLDDVSHEMIFLRLPLYMSPLQSLAFLWLRREKPVLFEGVKVSTFQDVSHEMLVLM